MDITDVIAAIQNATDRHAAMQIANGVAMESQKGQRDASDERAVRDAWYARWGSEPKSLGDAGPRHGTNWTGD